MEGLPGHPVQRPRRRAGDRPAGHRPLLSQPRRLVLLRHGRTADNHGGRIQGQLDTPLDEVGRAQAEAAAQVLAALPPAVLLSSDLSRARDTAAALATAAGLPAVLDRRLRELHLGTWEGLSSPEARERHPEEHAAWRRGLDVRRGGGETHREAGDRAVACLAEHLPVVPPGGTLVAVTHGGTAKAAVGVLLELPSASWGRLIALGNARWSVLVESDLGWRLERHNTGLTAVGGELARGPGESSSGPAGHRPL
ncbi:MAG: histidine phosphatase family protein [Mycobacteriales bacterium]